MCIQWVVRRWKVAELNFWWNWNYRILFFYLFICVGFCICFEFFFLWFGLVSLFNGISTLFRLFNAKAILLEEQYLTHSWEDKGVHTLPESECNSATGVRTRVLRFRSSLI